MTRSKSDPAAGAPAPGQAAREARLAQALRANLKRRKAPLRPAAAPSAGPDAPRVRGEDAEDN